MSVQSAAGYRYHNPEINNYHMREWEVVSVNPHDPALRELAVKYQSVIHEALADALHPRYNRDQIALTADPSNQKLVRAQQQRLAAVVPGKSPHYVHAQVKLPDWVRVGLGSSPHIVGVGKGKLADSRSRAQRLLHSDTPAEAQLADVSDTYVTPYFRLGAGGISFQYQGKGSSILRSLLDGYPPAMNTVIYDYAENHALQPVLANLGFEAVQSWKVSQFGRRDVAQIRYAGPTVAELVSTLEEHHPWLVERIPLSG